MSRRERDKFHYEIDLSLELKSGIVTAFFRRIFKSVLCCDSICAVRQGVVDDDVMS